MNSDTLLAQAKAAHQVGNFAEAEQLYRAALQGAPDDPEALRFLGVLFSHSGNFVEAESHLARAAGLSSATHLTHQNHAVALMGLERFAEAVAACDRAIALQPDYANAFYQRGRALAKLARFEDAAASYERAIVLNPRDPTGYYMLGVAYAALNRRDDAFDVYDKAIALNPDFLEALVNRGSILLDTGRNREALSDFERALAVNDGFAQAHANRGVALSNLGFFEEADASFAAAIALDPECATAYYNRSTIYMHLKHYEEALQAKRQAAHINPDLPGLQGSILNSALQLCDWNDFDDLCRNIIIQLEQGRQVAPFDLLHIPTTLQQQKKAAERQAARHIVGAPLKLPETRKPDRIRIGYLSSDFKEHPVSYLLSDTLECHNRDAFEIFGISFGDDDKSKARNRISSACEHFHDVRELGDRQIAEQIRALDIDILVELGGHTSYACTRILPFRPAPIQVSWLGYAGTTGVPQMDYLLADAVVAPLEHASFYTENIVRLPDCYLPPSARPIADTVMSRQEAGLPSDGFVFCAFNNSFKILPEVFSSWMRILSQVKGSVLWLRGDSKVLQSNLRREAQARGIDPERIVFAPYVGAKAHFARLALADLFLDTAPYNAHTTASDALWAGVPVLTVLGNSFVSRVAASLLTSAGLKELIVATPREYEDMAVMLASDPRQPAAIRQMVANARTTPVFDIDRFTRHLESAYKMMVERHSSGASPESFAVPRTS